MECPICKLASITQDKDKCPQCESDLTCFRILEAFPEPEGTDVSSLPELEKTKILSAPSPEPEETKVFTSTEPEPEKTKVLPASEITIPKSTTHLFPIIFLAIYMFLSLAMMFFFQESRFRIIENLIADQRKYSNDTVKELGRNLKQLVETILHNQEINSSNQKQKNIPVDIPKRTSTELKKPSDDVALFSYSTKKNDSLWRIAKKYYHSGYYYPVLLVHNPDIAIHQIKEKTNLFILKENKLVKDIYSRVTEKKNGRLFFIYTVKQGDTFTSIINRYCPLKNCEEIIFNNSDKYLLPGKQIKILLE